MLPKEYFDTNNPYKKTWINKLGDSEKLFFLPFVGEFGFYITKHIRNVYRIKAEKIKYTLGEIDGAKSKVLIRGKPLFLEKRFSVD